ncbi:MAG TPA: PP2C family protein-serine/threonine phosphatase [Solirubrobacteraceae bacterium]|nr:PP2C family protein-serine/threonine phosphatase [Solirubrobacteraceae bacterium]
MASDGEARIGLGRPARRLTLACLACCGLGLGFIPAATAKREREAASSTTTAAGQSTQAASGSTAGHGASGAQGTAGDQGSSAGQAASGAQESKAASGRQGSSASQGGGSSASKGSGASGARNTGGNGAGGHAHQAPAAKRPASEARSNSATGAAKHAEQQASPGDATVGAQAQARDSGHGQGGHKPGKGHHKESAGESSRAKESGRRGKGKSEEKSEGKSEGSKPEESAGSAPGGSTQAPTATTTAPALTSAPLASVSSTPAHAALGLSKPLHVAHPRAARRGATGRAPARAAVRPFAGALGFAAPGALAAGSPAAAPARGTHASDPHRPSPVGPASRLVTTITKIVDVVPTAVRELIAALLALALGLAARSLYSALRARRLERQRRELLDDVGLLQAALLPEPPARLGPVGTSVAYRPAAGPGAGGDFYDVFALQDGQLAVIVGDVSGHGRQALPHTALVRFTLRAYLEAGLSPREALQTAGAVLERQLGGVFATVVAATYQPRERVLTYSCAGHPPPLVLGPQPDARSLSPVTICASPPIGAGMRTGTRQTVVSLPGRAHVCFYTDGVTEARVGAELFGAQRLTDTLAELGPDPSAAQLLERVAELADARPDDMAACVLSVAGEDAQPRVLVEELEIDRAQATSARTESFLRACGVRHEEIAAAIGSARGAAGRAGTVVLEVSAADGPPEVALRRDQVAYLHARRVEAGALR